jgi:FkbM family methyltransferase
VRLEVSMSEVKYYSQVGQDKEINKLLGNRRGGYFIDIGATDGVGISNTYFFERELGWDGVCVEPNRYFYEKLIVNRKCHCDESAIYNYNGMISFSPNNVYGGINDLEVTDKINDKVECYDVPCITIEELFKRYEVPRVIDYLSMDTEGSELKILESFPFSEYAFRAISVEHNRHLGERQKRKSEMIYELLESKGYTFHQNLVMDFIFYKKELI